MTNKLTRFADIVGAFKRSLSNISWMDKESATAASEKVERFVVDRMS